MTEAISILSLYFIGPVLLFLTHRFGLKKSFGDASGFVRTIFVTTGFNLTGLLVVLVVRRAVGCHTWIGDCYAEIYYPNFDYLYMLVFSSALIVDVLSVFVLGSIAFGFLRNKAN